MPNRSTILALLLTVTTLYGESAMPNEEPTAPKHRVVSSEIATLGGGCFWCIEAVFEQQDGVLDVNSGYMGGKIPDPSYRQVCSGTSGHAEVCRITYDPAVISFDQLLDLFWQSHDPTQLNRQGADVGTQYRSVIFYHSDAQKQAAIASKKALDQSKSHLRNVVTLIEPAARYYPADASHQDFYRKNPRAGYCQVVIRPKLKKLGLPDKP